MAAGCPVKNIVEVAIAEISSETEALTGGINCISVAGLGWRYSV